MPVDEFKKPPLPLPSPAPSVSSYNKYSCYLSESVFRLVASFFGHLACLFNPDGSRLEEASEMPTKTSHQAKYKSMLKLR